MFTLIPETSVLPVVRVVPVSPRLGGAGAGDVAGARLRSGHAGHVAQISCAGPSCGHRATVVNLLLSLDHSWWRSFECVFEVSVFLILVIPAALIYLGSGGELSPPMVLVPATSDSVDIPPHEHHVTPGPPHLLLQHVDLLAQLGFQTQLQVVESHVVRYIICLGPGAWSPR